MVVDVELSLIWPGVQLLTSLRLLEDLNLGTCNHVTDESVSLLTSLRNLQYLAIEDCPRVTLTPEDVLVQCHRKRIKRYVS